MKRFLRILVNGLIFALCAACLFSCGDPATDDGASDDHTVVGVVTNVKNEIKINVSLNNDYIVKISPDTVIVDAAGKTITKDDIKVGVEIKVTYDGIATRSIPPQITAKTINVGSFVADKTSSIEESFIMSARVKSLGEKLLVEVIESPYADGEYVVNTSPTTNVITADGAAAFLSDIKVGDTIEITYTGQVMLSLPAQIIALEIVIK